MHKLQRLSIEWNYNNDTLLTIAKSHDPVLEEFFSMQDWDFVRHCFMDIWEESEAEFGDKRIDFNHGIVNLYVHNNCTSIERAESLRVFLYLYDLMIVGANDDHHSVRYEPWWQEFTEVYYQLRCKIEILEALEEEMVNV